MRYHIIHEIPQPQCSRHAESLVLHESDLNLLSSEQLFLEHL